MKLAAGDFAVWLIIAIIVIIGKIWNKFVETQADEKESSPAPPPAHRARPPSPRPNVPSSAPPVVRPVSVETRQALPQDLRQVMERLARPVQPKPVALPPPPPVVAEEPEAKPAPPKPAPAPAGSASRWAQALSDRQNLRNIIISAEIIGPPRGA